MATNRNIYDLRTLAKTSVDSNDYLEVANQTTKAPSKLLVSSLFPTFSTTGTGSENIWIDITNKNQLNFKGIKSGDTGLLTVATTSNNIVLTALEAGIDLSLCNNTSSGFISGIDFSGTVTGENLVINGGTGLSTIAKGAVLYADATDSLAASTAMSTNGQLLIGNATAGYPSVATLTAGSNVTITNGAGSITIAASLTTLAADLDCDNNDIDLGTGYLSSDGNQNGIRVTGSNAYIGASGNYHDSDVLNLAGGGIRFSNTASVDIKPNATTSSTAGQPVTIEAGSSASGNAGKLTLKGGTAASGGGNGGDVEIYGGSEAGGTAASIKNYVYDGSGSAVESLTVEGNSANPNVKVCKGNLVITEATKGIIHTGSGVVTQATNHSTDVTINSTSGVITLAGVALAAGAEADFAVTNSTVQTDSVILLTVQSPAAASATDNATLIAQLDAVANGSFNIRLTNPGAATTSTNAHKIHFLVINNS
tara:strand:+ start:1027 stop:2469 length:1443 start_codon:yes stop_codon:yes gene_type:complete